MDRTSTWIVTGVLGLVCLGCGDSMEPGPPVSMGTAEMDSRLVDLALTGFRFDRGEVEAYPIPLETLPDLTVTAATNSAGDPIAVLLAVRRTWVRSG